MHYNAATHFEIKRSLWGSVALALPAEIPPTSLVAAYGTPGRISGIPCLT